jgi:hypothetical protein
MQDSKNATYAYIRETSGGLAWTRTTGHGEAELKTETLMRVPADGSLALLVAENDDRPFVLKHGPADEVETYRKVAQAHLRDRTNLSHMPFDGLAAAFGMDAATMRSSLETEASAMADGMTVLSIEVAGLDDETLDEINLSIGSMQYVRNLIEWQVSKAAP